MFLCEHWINKFDKNTFDNLSLNKNINKIFSSPMNHVNNKGRPWGGLGWFISKKIEILRHEVLEDGISLIEIKYKNEKLVLIGVYLACVSSNFEVKMEKLLREIKFNNAIRETEDIKEKIDRYYNQITYPVVKAHEGIVDKFSSKVSYNG